MEDFGVGVGIHDRDERRRSLAFRYKVDVILWKEVFSIEISDDPKSGWPFVWGIEEQPRIRVCRREHRGIRSCVHKPRKGQKPVNVRPPAVFLGFGEQITCYFLANVHAPERNTKTSIEDPCF